LIRYIEKDNGLIFTVRVVPRASKTEIAGALDGALKVRIALPPVNGAANAELVKFLSKTFGVAKTEIEIISGETSKTKQIRISNLKSEKFLEILHLK
jgi:uncharacterized protein (TIGR00251 family)